MGAYSPAPVINNDIEERIMAEVIRPTLAGMENDGTPYLGFLYAGLMIMADGTPKVIEFNCRLGDPETQPILMRLKSDLARICHAALEGTLAEQRAEWDDRAALGVVMAAGGYPESYDKGDRISGLDQIDGDDLKVFHAGTALQDEQVVTNGGRVLCVVGLGERVQDAAAVAYRGTDAISWVGASLRRDIGHRAIARENA
jgi:phosphoribosylamine--glycine ligase